jgi:thiol-disulfide isomerase/thioredoxin
VRVTRFLLIAVFWLPVVAQAAPYDDVFAAQNLQRLDETAPDFLLRDASGGQLRLSELRGRPVILHFWATWCGPCRHELPALDALARTLADRDVAFLAVAIDSDTEAARIRRYAQDLGVTCPVYLASEGAVTDRYWSWGIPVTYLIDRDGQLVGRALGERDWTSVAMQAVLNTPVFAGR